MKILVTGGAGYIGSTVCWALKDKGFEPIVLDSLVTGRREFAEAHIFYEGDISDAALVRKIFDEHPSIEGVIHCAALIIVPESVAKPYEYYKENVSKSIEFFHTLKELGCKKIVFSSSASVYATVEGFLCDETAPLNPLSPYSRTKAMMELVLKDYCAAYDMWGIALRYFNPIGADPKMRCGPYVQNATHILNTLVNVHLGNLKEFVVTGGDYPTRDGTGIRDYLHVWDLARAHVHAIEYFENVFRDQTSRYAVVNLGTGNGVTVREFLQAFENVVGRAIPKMEGPRRPGDAPGYFASAERAKTYLNWSSELSIEDGVRDAFRWAEVWKNKLKKN